MAKKEEEAARSGGSLIPENAKRLLIPVKLFVFSLVTAASSVRGAHIDTRIRINGDSS